MGVLLRIYGDGSWLQIVLNRSGFFAVEKSKPAILRRMQPRVKELTPNALKNDWQTKAIQLYTLACLRVACAAWSKPLAQFGERARG